MSGETIVTQSSLTEGKLRQFPPSEPFAPRVPLVVDLDGTLIRTDLLIESLLALLKDKPRFVFALPFWLLKGRAAFKQEVARRISLNASLIPYRSELVEYLRTQRAKGRLVVLATANDKRLAQQVADHLKLFDSVLATDGSTNLSGERKRERLVNEFGEKGFDYAANGSRDIAVWSSARKAVMFNPSRQLVRAVARVTQVHSVFEDRRARFGEYLYALRPPHWLKNLLVFVPLFAAHRFDEAALLGKTLFAFMAFCFCASSGYLFNDLFDLAADRRHPQKRLRPFAAGRLPLSYALAMIPVLVVLACGIGMMVSRSLLGILLLYFALTLTYSVFIKKLVLLDVIVLASLYTLRLMAGSAAVAIWPSEWLLAFSMFLFLSLALVKRYDELIVMRGMDGDRARARNYEISDAELLASKGTASGYIAVLVLALYINSGTAKALYGRYEFIWVLCPLLLYWVGHIWLVAHRGKLHDDPVVFAVRDRTSRILMLLMLGVVLLAI
jgi:4-hydroxybenzoate polyprenyltransferase/phosphoserine phosphatase